MQHTWEENPYELSCQTGIITGDKCNHKGLVEKEKIVLSDYKTKVSGEMKNGGYQNINNVM